MNAKKTSSPAVKDDRAVRKEVSPVSPENKIHKDEISQLISKGRKQGFLLFEEIDKTFTEDLDSEEDFDDFLSSMDNYGIKILDQKQKEIAPKRRKSELLTLQGLERTTDPVKLYLREMGNISLLTREGEISIAREIERGEKSIIKALSRTRLVLNQVLALEDRIKENPFIIQEMFDVSEEDIAEGRLEEKKKQILGKVKRIRELSRKLDRVPEKKKTLVSRGRIIVKISRTIRDLNLRSAHREKIIDEFNRLITGNHIFIERLIDVVTIPPDDAIDFCLTGPNLRASGVDWDLRRDEPYSIYKELQFRVPVGTNDVGVIGDTYNRFVVRVEEMRECCGIVRQCLAMLPATAGEDPVPKPKTLKPPKGEVYLRTEAPRGELGMYVVSSGTDKPWRVRARTG